MSIASAHTAVPKLLDQENRTGDKAKEQPPDTARGWLVVAGSTCMNMFSFGPCNAFGVYLEEYHRSVFPGASSSLLSWIGTLQFGFMCFFCIGAGLLVERFDTRFIVFGGGLISGSSLLLASTSHSPIALLLTQGLVYGVGASCFMITGMSLPSQWMVRHRAIASGIASSGGSIGGLWMSFATQKMVSQLGWQWSLRITGLIIASVSIAVSPLMQKRVSVPKREGVLDLAALKNMQFVLLFLGGLFVTGANIQPYNFMPSYVVEVLDQPPSWGANISSIINGVSILGRFASGPIANIIGTLNTLYISAIISTIAILAMWLPSNGLGLLVSSGAIFGFFTGCIMPLIPVAAANLFGTKRLPSIIGLLLLAYSIGIFICVPIGGVLLEVYGGANDYTAPIVFAGVVFGLAALSFIALRILLQPNLIKCL